MIQDITIKNFGLIKHSSFSLNHGLLAVVGATGAGKSMLLKAIAFLFGLRHNVEAPQNAVDTFVSCRLAHNAWSILKKCLDDKALAKISEPKADSIVLERRFSEKRARAFIQGVPITKTQLIKISTQLVYIHHQHQHLSFQSSTTQREYLDNFVQNNSLITDTHTFYHTWQHLLIEKKQLQSQLASLSNPNYYQAIIDEFHELGLDSADIEKLHQQQKKLQSRQAFLQQTHNILSRIDGEQSSCILPSLFHIQQDISQYVDIYQDLSSAHAAIDEAITLISEAQNQLQSYAQDDYEDDHQRLQEVENQLSSLYQFARKYNTSAEQLHSFIEDVEQRITHHADLSKAVEEIHSRILQTEKAFYTSAENLHDARLAAAKTLTALVKQKLPSLALEHADFAVTCQFDKFQASSFGCDNVNFLFNAQCSAGHPLLPLADCASGGELSRLALILSLTSPRDTSLMIFDEADVGVSGAVAGLVGNFLKQHATTFSMLCITHSPQVAAKADKHLFVQKTQSNEDWVSTVTELEGEGRIEAVASLLGDQHVTATTLANARELCQVD